MGYTPSLNFGDASASVARPVVIGELVRHILSDQPTWAMVEPFLKPPGMGGSKEYDHSDVAGIVLAHDSVDGEKLRKLGISKRVLWDYIYRELAKVFDVRQGRVMGLLSYTATVDPKGTVKMPEGLATADSTD